MRNELKFLNVSPTTNITLNILFSIDMIIIAGSLFKLFTVICHGVTPMCPPGGTYSIAGTLTSATDLASSRSVAVCGPDTRYRAKRPRAQRPVIRPQRPRDQRPTLHQ